jgi:hypothetical protein
MKYLFYIAAVTVLMWFKVLGQTFLGEGYYYFASVQDFTDGSLWQYDNFARILFDILPPVFGANITYYLVLQLLFIVLLNITVYITLQTITRNKLLSFVATILFAASYIGMFEMYAIGNYQRFVQRIPNLLPLLASFIYLHKFLDKHLKKHLALSVTLFALALFMGHFSTFLLPLFVIYPLAVAYYEKSSIRIPLALSTIFICVNALIISTDHHTPDIGILEFITLDHKIVEKMFAQLGNAASLLFIMSTFASRMALLGGIIFLVFVLGLYFLKRSEKYKHLLPLYSTSLFSVFGIFFLNLYSYGAGINPLHGFGQSRFYFLSTLPIAFMWTVLAILLLKKHKHLKKALFVILSLYVLYNYILVSRDIEGIQYKSTAMKQYVSYIQSISSQFTPDSIIVMPSSLLWPAPLITEFWGYPTMRFIDYYEGWEEKTENLQRDNVFVIDYDIKGEQIIDQTKEYRTTGVVKFIGQ